MVLWCKYCDSMADVAAVVIVSIPLMFAAASILDFEDSWSSSVGYDAWVEVTRDVVTVCLSSED